jgi:hypothetical protein
MAASFNLAFFISFYFYPEGKFVTKPFLFCFLQPERNEIGIFVNQWSESRRQQGMGRDCC